MTSGEHLGKSMNPQSYLILLRPPRSQSKKGLQQAAASQEEEQGKRRKRKVKDSGLEITRLDVEEVSTFKAGMQPSPRRLLLFEHWTLSHAFLDAGIQPALVCVSVGRAMWVQFPTAQVCTLSSPVE